VDWAKKIFVLGVVACWALVTNHCKLENIPGLTFIACAEPAEEAGHQPSDCGEKDSCATVEGGLYKTEESQVSPGKATPIPISLAVDLLCNLAVPEPFLSPVSPKPTPPEFESAWQFSSRAALPPRAPSLLS